MPPDARRRPRLFKLNRTLARQLGLDPDALATPEGVEILAGKRVPEGAEPLAQAYAGHQFGHFVPQLGDGRASCWVRSSTRWRPPRHPAQGLGPHAVFAARRRPGRAGPVLREYIVSEAMAALGIPTTRSLAAVMTGEPCCARPFCPAPC